LAVVLGLPIAASAGFHASIGYVLRWGITEHWWAAALGVVLFSLVIASAGLAAAVTRTRQPLWIVPFGVAISSPLAGFAWQTAVGGGLEVAALVTLMINVRHEESGRVRFSVVKILTYGMTLVIALMLLGVAFFSYAGFSRGATTGKLQDALVEGTVKTLNGSLPVFLKGYAPAMTVDEFIGLQLPDIQAIVSDLSASGFTADDRAKFEQQLLGQGIDPKSADLDRLFAARPDERQVLVAEINRQLSETTQAAISTARDRIAESFGVTLQGSERVDDAFRKILHERISRLTRPNEHLVPPLLAISLFLTLELFTFVYIWLIWLMGLILFFLYRNFNLVLRVEEEVQAIRYEVAGEVGR